MPYHDMNVCVRVCVSRWAGNVRQHHLYCGAEKVWRSSGYYYLRHRGTFWPHHHIWTDQERSGREVNTLSHSLSQDSRSPWWRIFNVAVRLLKSLCVCVCVWMCVSPGQGRSTSEIGSWPSTVSVLRENLWVKPSTCCKWLERRSHSKLKNNLTVRICFFDCCFLCQQ